MTSPAEQARILLAMILCGAALGAVYQAFCAAACLIGGRFALAAADLAFGAAAAAGIILAGLTLRIDVMRWYVFAGAGLGMALYMASLGAAFMRLGAAIRRLGKKASGHTEKDGRCERNWRSEDECITYASFREENGFEEGCQEKEKEMGGNCCMD